MEDNEQQDASESPLPPPPGEPTSPSTEAPVARPPEFGGRDGPDPTRYGDWEKNGRCIDF